MTPDQMPTVSHLVLAWGPGLAFMLGAGFVLYRLGGQLITAQIESRRQQFEIVKQFAERFLLSQDSQAKAFTSLAASVEHGLNEQRDTTIALQALALKVEEMKRMLEMQRP